MAHVKKGHLVPAPQWWKHLRPFWKRLFWKRHRMTERADFERCAGMLGSGGEAIKVLLEERAKDHDR